MKPLKLAEFICPTSQSYQMAEPGFEFLLGILTIMPRSKTKTNTTRAMGQLVD